MFFYQAGDVIDNFYFGLKGISAYCGALWIAALEAAIQMGEILLECPPTNLDLRPKDYPQSIEGAIATYKTWLSQSRAVYHQTLWNGKYYRLDSESGSEVVMADQLCGQFYARLLALPDVVETQYAQSALQEVYDACFLKFHNGELGAVNGLKPGGIPEDPDATHPLEMWTGINYGIAAFLLQMGRKEDAFKLTEVVVKQVYENGL